MPNDQTPAHELVSKFEQARDLPSFDTAFKSAVLMSQADSGSWKEAQGKLQQTDLAPLGLAGFKIDGLNTQPKDSSGYALPPELNISNKSGVIEHIDAQGNVLDALNNPTGQLSFADNNHQVGQPSDILPAAPGLSNPIVALDTPIATPAAPTDTSGVLLKPADVGQVQTNTSDLAAPPTGTDKPPLVPEGGPAEGPPPAGSNDAPGNVSPIESVPPKTNTTPSEAPVVAPPGDGPLTAPNPNTSDAPTVTPPGDRAPTTPDTTDSTTSSGTPFGPNGRSMTMSTDGTTGVYGIQGGDTLWSIAQDALTAPGQTLTIEQQAALAPQILGLVDQIAQDNNITNPDEIYPGQQLTIRKQSPDASTGTPSDGSTAQQQNEQGPLAMLNNQLFGQMGGGGMPGGGGDTSGGGGGDDSDGSESTGYSDDQDDNMGSDSGE